MANASVLKFRKLTQALQREVHDAAVSELLNQAIGLKDLIASVAPVGETGELAHSVRVEPDKKKDTIVRIVAGGNLTIRRSLSAKPYNYARADEFGTVKMPAKPFFFPTYRLSKKKIIAAMKRRITASIKRRSAAP